MTQHLEPIVALPNGSVNPPSEPEMSVVWLALFHETNEHIRSADQKQVSVVGAYLGMIGLVLSLLPGGVIRILYGTRDGALIYLFLFVVGCCVALYQAWCRIWKVHYLETLRELTKDCTLADSVLPYWLRKTTEEEPPAWRRLNIDNTFLYFTVLLNTALFVLVSYQLWYLLRVDWRTLAVAILSLVYAWFIFLLYRVATNHRSNLVA
jgi:hypothetical protein